jgi:hypothetical protein
MHASNALSFTAAADYPGRVGRSRSSEACERRRQQNAQVLAVWGPRLRAEMKAWIKGVELRGLRTQWVRSCRPVRRIRFRSAATRRGPPRLPDESDPPPVGRLIRRAS